RESVHSIHLAPSMPSPAPLSMSGPPNPSVLQLPPRQTITTGSCHCTGRVPIKLVFLMQERGVPVRKHDKSRLFDDEQQEEETARIPQGSQDAPEWKWCAGQD
ncbi:hypothetical protein AVEN_87240-1, partial [Araneus ventricosus]